MAEQFYKLAVLGDPIRHSLSPMIHNHWLRSCNLSGDYQPIQTPATDLIHTLQQLEKTGFTGCNLTLPLKEILFEKNTHLPAHTISEEATATGAINTVFFHRTEWHLHNTDVAGLAFALSRLGCNDLHGRRVLIIGAGGAARSAARLAARQHARLTIVNRTPTRAKKLAEELAPEAKIEAFPITPSLLDLHDIILQTTSAWVGGTGYRLPDSVDLSGKVALDLMYAPDSTPFVHWATRQGAQAGDGLTMLVAQAAESFALWTGQRPDINKTLTWLEPKLALREE